MSSLKLIMSLWLRSFSFKKGSLRWPTRRRVLVIFFFIPLLILHVLFTRVLLLLDGVFFPAYKKHSTDRSLFIVGVPRSGTSFLLNLMGKDQQTFTSFKLWEMVFAPSIIQKKYCLWLYRKSKRVGININSLIERVNTICFDKLQGIHNMRLNSLEEDELLYIYLFQSAYLIFLFPELEDFHQLLNPDNNVNRTRSTQFYRELVQRHLYVFDSKSSKYFLSKNPFYPIRLTSLTTIFPNSRYLLIKRSLEDTIPSTISLNKHLYAYCCSDYLENPLRQQTIEMLLRWDAVFQEFKFPLAHQVRTISFNQLVKNPSYEISVIRDWLGLAMNNSYMQYLWSQDQYSKKYKSIHRYPRLSVQELGMINNHLY